MNIDLKDFPSKIKPVVAWVKRHRAVIAVILVLLLYTAMVLKINALSRREPTDDEVTEKLQTIKRPIIDDATIMKIEQLKETNVDVETLFKEARENPFQE